jgi:hypothetical protein
MSVAAHRPGRCLRRDSEARTHGQAECEADDTPVLAGARSRQGFSQETKAMAPTTVRIVPIELPLLASEDVMTSMRVIQHGSTSISITACELQDLLVATLVSTAGGSMRRWRVALGPVQLLGPASSSSCNWCVTPSGGGREIVEIERLLEAARRQYPFIIGD